MRRAGLRWIAAGTALSLPAAGLVTVDALTARSPALAASSAAASSAVAKEQPASPAPSRADVTARPDQLSALMAARSTGHRVRVTDLDDAASTTYVNPDGTLTTDSYAGPIRVRRDGRWVDVDTTLRAVGGTVSPRAVPQALSLSAGGDHRAVTVSGSHGSFGLSWPGKLPAPALDGDTATYRDVAPGVDLVVQATRRGFELSVRLTRRPTRPLALRLPMRVSGWSVRTAADGGLRLVGPSGRVVAAADAPVMYDATVDPASGGPAHVHAVSTRLAGTARTPVLLLTPDTAFLADPSVRYPVTIDPTTTLADSADTWVESDFASSQYGSTELRVGTYDGGTSIARSYLRFSTSALTGKDVRTATLHAYETWSYSCTAADVYVSALNSDFSSSTTWATRPTSWDYYGTTTFAHGYSSACPDAWQSLDVTSLVQDWVTGAHANHGLQLRGSETSSSGWKKLTSGNASSNVPYISATYNSYPATPSGIAAAPYSSGYTNTLTPTMSAKVTDPDGGTVWAAFDVYDKSTGTLVAVRKGIAGTHVTSGGTSTAAAPTLQDGHLYRIYAWGEDGTDSSLGTTAGFGFTVDVSKPAAPAVSSSTWALQTYGPATSGQFSWSDSSTDVASYSYWLDGAAATTVPATTTSATVAATPGWHTFHVQAVDRAGNVAPSVGYSFGVGSYGALTSPADQSTTQKQASLTALSGYGYVSYRYRAGTTGAFADVPVADVTKAADGSALAQWPVAANGTTDGQNSYPTLTWTMSRTLAADGVAQVEACFFTNATDTTAAGCSPAATVQLAAHDFGGVARDVGPGSVSLLTGNFQVSAGDVSVPAYNDSLTISRTATTLAPVPARADASGIFGPSWTATLPLTEGGAADLTLVDHSSAGYLMLLDPDGSEYDYQATSGGYVGVGDANDGSRITSDCAGVTPAAGATCWTLADADGTTTTWTGSGSAFTIAAVTEPGSLTTSYGYDGQGRVTQILGPVPPGVTCTGAGVDPTTVAGCRVLTLSYATATTATSSDWGDYTGRVKSISFTAANPGNGDAMTTVVVARYLYGNSGWLRATWDPRLDYTDAGGVLQHVRTTYAYDGNHRLTTVTPPGLAAWTLAYDTAGRLATVSRADGNGGTATTTLVYDLPPAGVTGLPDVSGSTATGAGRWGQTDLATTGAAMFAPDYPVPVRDAQTLDYAPAGNDWHHAAVSYLDVNGREVDTAHYDGAWRVSSAEYDQWGNVVRSLTAGNVAEALDVTGSQAGYDDEIGTYIPTGGSCATALACQQARADLLATEATYTADGTEQVELVGPLHRVMLSDGPSDGRSDVRTAYDEGAPGGGVSTTGTPYHLATSQVTGILTTDGVVHDPVEVDLGYAPLATGQGSGWELRQPTTVTTVMADGHPIVSRTGYDSAGREVESRMPSDSAGTGAGTTLTTYYQATGTGSCVSKSMAGLVCTVAPAAQPATGPALPVTTTLYDMWGRATTVTEVSGTGTGAVTRTTSARYGYGDASNPDAPTPYWTSVSVTPTGALGSAVPTTYTCFDKPTGLPTTTQTVACGSTGGSAVSTGYDNLGRVVTYTDSLGAVTTRGYDVDGRTTTVDDGKATTTYSYDATSGQLTGLTDGEAGSFTATYDEDGALATQTYPNGLVATWSKDEAGQVVGLRYDLPGSTSPWPSFTADYNASGRVAAESSDEALLSYGYDNAGRLTSAREESHVGSTTCALRAYQFDGTTGAGLDSDRTGYAEYPYAGVDADGNCLTDTTPALTAGHAYDAADRLTDTGYSYDAFGRSTAIPAAGTAGGTAMSVDYFTTDMLHSETSGGTSKTWSLDPAGRLTQETVAGFPSGNGTLTNHFADDSDSPRWVAEVDGTWTRTIAGLDGQLAASYASGSAATELQLTDLHGDVVATCDASTAVTGTDARYQYTEFGGPDGSTATPARYGWLGGKTRSSDGLGGLMLMGVRVYDPTIGRFLQTDPLPGGSANSYDYAGQDPVNAFDLDGRCFWCVVQAVVAVATVVAFLPVAPAVVVAAASAIAAAGSAMTVYHDIREHDWWGLATDITGAIGGLGEAVQGIRMARAARAMRQTADRMRGFRGARIMRRRAIRATRRRMRRYERVAHRYHGMSRWSAVSLLAYNSYHGYRSRYE